MTELEQQLTELQTIIDWDPTVVTQSGRFNIAKTATYLNTSTENTKTILQTLKTHLEECVDDNDFCNFIHWAHPRYPFKHTGWEDFAGPLK
tara:strand:+ start:382 stop:654 length:273 start_codon:yes stop_codon:yes gene_type:complete